ncbi:DUF4336 domain-containing protein [Ottowia testudinis]|uniref:DUF4336 domain-containing protein n=1 Tax=Ottowia testudinis TaxID=2816950 RepID=A0A975CDU6_9BURK|nr:DUF4336 domain-containing protein [Ottowia testudinis]QTD44425.1 DUF4336 domain-containing protein [Ottowia testudinis]
MLPRLIPLADGLACVQHPMKVNGVPVTTRMTVIRLTDGSLWVHSPVPLDGQTRAELDRMGPVRHVVAPSLMHHLFVNDFARNYPNAAIHGAPGLSAKRPDPVGLKLLDKAPGPWSPELQFILFGGIPLANETVWFHAPTATLILTDLCQCWQGPMPWAARWWSTLTQTRDRFDMPLHVRWLVRDKAAARASANAILRWPFERVIMGHTAVITHDAQAQVRHALRHVL